jgi:signal transduction histidine kinase
MNITVSGLLARPAAWVTERVTAHRRLREEHRRLTELEAWKSAFLRLAAHELRTPLALARGYVEMVSTDSLGAVPVPAREALSLVDAKLLEIDELVGHMTQVARLHSDQAQLDLEVLDVREVVRDALERSRPLADDGHRLVVDQPAQPVLAAVDRLRLRIGLVNLLGNAIKYSPDGGEVRCSVLSTGRWIQVTVADQGLGIDPELIDQLFQPFSRLAQAGNRRIPGLGLGLHVAREIARAHGGDLSAAANLERGSTFVLSLPARKAGAQVSPTGPACPDRPGESRSDLPAGAAAWSLRPRGAAAPG